MKFIDIIEKDLLIPQLESTTKQATILEIAQFIQVAHPEILSEPLTKLLLQRESLSSTAIGKDVAIPHAKIEAATRIIVSVAIAPHGVLFGANNEELTYLFFVLIAPQQSSGLHLKALARISRLCKEARFRERLIQAKSSIEMFDIIQDEDDKIQ